MRPAIGIVLAAGALVALLVYLADRPGGARDTHDAPTPPAPRDTPEPAGPNLADFLVDPASTDIAALVETWVAAGDVAELDLLLRSGRDVRLSGDWSVADGNLAGIPTLRAAALLALARIEGPAATAALRRVLDGGCATGEAFLVAQALAARGADGWAPAALDAVTAEATPGHEHLQRAIVAIAARGVPAETARRIEDRAPRGTKGRDPGALATGLAHLPWDAAQQAARRLLEDGGVTPKARRRYAEALAAHAEPRALTLLDDAVGRLPLPQREAARLAETVAESPAFEADVEAYEAARAAGDETAAGAARARLAARLAAARRLLKTLGADAEAREALDAHARRVELSD